VVYLARQTDLDRQVALKELRMFQSPDDPALAERFLREARMAGSMSHPNIVTVHEHFKHEGTPYIAMEYLQRGSLRPWVGSLTLAQIAGVLEGLLAALDHAERFRIVHRDLKPENLLVTDQGQVKVADFGIAKASSMNTNAFLTKEGMTVGTPTYMAPEQAMAQELGPYTDLYSVGVMAYELLVGRVPFHDTDTPVAIILRHVNEDIPPAHTVNPAIDRALSDWIERLLVKEPELRTPTAEQAWDELEEVVLRLLGSRWRREARLLGSSEQPTARPLTPAPFTSTATETPVPPNPVAQPPAPPVVETPSDADATPEFLTFAKPAPPAEHSEPVPAPSAAASPPPAPASPPAPPPPLSPPPAHAPAPTASPAHAPARAASSMPPPTPPPTPAPAPGTPAAKPVWATASDPALFAVEAPTVMPDALPQRPQAPPSTGPSPQVVRRRRIALAGAGAGVAAIAVVGVLLAGGGGSGGDSGADAQPGGLRTGDLALNVPTAWHEQAVPDIPGLPARDAVAAGGPGGAFVVAEHVAGRADPTLLPAKLRTALVGGAPKPEAVEVAGTNALRYDGLRARGVDGRLRVYAVLTSDGVATIACGSPATASECDDIADTLTLASAKAVPAGLSDGYSALLTKTIETFNRGVAGVNTSVADAGTPKARAAALRGATGLYRTAVASLGKAADGSNPLDLGQNARLVAGFKRLASDYARLARAAARNDAAALRGARRGIAQTRSKVAAVTAGLRRLGYAGALPTTPDTPRSAFPSTPSAPLAPSSGAPQPVPQTAPKTTAPPPPAAKQPPAEKPHRSQPPQQEKGDIG